jgi:hypothetical protein
VLLSPLGDLVRRRQLLLLLMTLAGSLSIGLALTHSLVAFETISFLVGVLSVTPQVGRFFCLHPASVLSVIDAWTGVGIDLDTADG